MRSYDQNGNPVISTSVETLNEDGSFSLTNPCPAGTYDILFKVEGGLAVLSEDVQLVAGMNNLVTDPVVLGDVNNNNAINIVDISSVISIFGTQSGDITYNYLKDLNCDGVVNVVDISIVTSRLGMSGAQFTAPAPGTSPE